MKFSILIPLYNVENYIKECLDSCINQTFDDFEIIIINDGSTDNGPKICADYEDSRIKLFDKENAGLLMARRDAIQRAQGDYIVFLDSDDKLRSNCLEFLNNIIEQSENSADLVLYNLYEWDVISGKTTARSALFKNGSVFDRDNNKILLERFLLTNDLNNLVTKAVRREILQSDETRYDEMGDSSYGEDKLQSFHIFSSANKIYYSSEPLYYYRKNPSSITNATVSLSKITKQINAHLESLSYKYAKMWNLDTPENIERISVSRLKFLHGRFCKCFGACESRKERIDCIKFEWFSLVHGEFKNHLDSQMLTFLQRTELKFILKKRYLILNVLRIARKVKRIFRKR